MEYKKKKWGRVKVESCSKNTSQGSVFTFQGKLDTCSKNFYISGNFKNSNGILSVTEKTVLVYEKINQHTITHDEMNYFMLEISPGPKERLELEKIFDKLPMSVENFKNLPNFKTFLVCDYFRFDYELPMRVLFQNQKRLKELETEKLIEMFNMLNIYPWKACFAVHMDKFNMKEASLKGFNTYKAKYHKKYILPMYTRALRLYAYMKEERERGNDLFDSETLIDSYLKSWSELADNQSDTLENMKPALEFLMYQGGVDRIDYTGKSGRFIGLRRDFLVNRHLIYDLGLMFASKEPNIKAWEPESKDAVFAQTIGTNWKDGTDGTVGSMGQLGQLDRSKTASLLFSPCIPSPLLSTDQQNVIKHALANKITLLEGAPGTGKTEVLVGVMAELCKRGINNKPHGPMVVTFIGMMVDSLQKRFGNRSETANTIHYICCKIENTEDSNVLAWIASFHVLIIDEGSNIDVRLFGRLIKCFPNLKQLVIVGDLGQIFPIKPGCPFYDLVKTFGNHAFLLTENKRVDSDSRNLAEAAALIRKGESASVNFNSPCLQMSDDRSDEKLKLIISEFVKNLKDTMDMQVIVLRNEDRNRLNKLIEEILIAKKILKKPYNCYNSNGCFLYPGKKIMFTKKCVNENYDMVRNGEMGQVKKIENDVLYLKNGKKVPVAEVELTPGYCTTCNKAQGSEWNNILFWMYENPNTFFTREFPYVAISRAKKKCIVIGKYEEFNRMCRYKAMERNTIFRYYLHLENIEDHLIPYEHLELSKNLKVLPMGELAVPIPPEKDETDTTKPYSKKHFSRFEYTKDQKKK